jgi:hypothetical protein
VSGAGRSVLIGFADALAAPEAAASLLGAGHGVTGFARRGRPAALRRMRGVRLVEVTAPEDDLAACLAEVAALADAHDVAMPLDDPAVLVCDRALPADAPVAGPRGALAELALDKRAQLRHAAAAGFSVPQWVELAARRRSPPPAGGPEAEGRGAEGREADGREAEGRGAEGREADGREAEGHGAEGRPEAERMGEAGGLRDAAGLPAGPALPAVLKPALAAEALDGRLRRLAPRLVSTPSELEALRGSWGSATPAILQRWVEGVGGGVFGLADDGEAHHLSAHRRVRMMNPAGSGSSACVSVPVPEELRGPVRQLMATARWDGMFMVELLHGAEGWWFMELNGRPWGSLALARRLGYEYPAWALARRLDGAARLPEQPAFQERLCRHLGRELVHLMFVLRGPGAHAGAWPGRAGTLRALLRDGRPTSWYNMAPGMRSVFLYDTWLTVANQTVRRRRR